MNIFEGMSFDQILMIHRLPADIGMFVSTYVFKQETKSMKTIEVMVVDQSIAPSGIGNYLACEILVHAKLTHSFRLIV